MSEFSDADIEGWEAAVARMWAAFEAGERRVEALQALLEPDESAREALLSQLLLASGTEDAQAMGLFGRVAIAGCAAAPVDAETGWLLIEEAAPEWPPARALLAQRARFP